MGLFGSSSTSTSTTAVNGKVRRALEHARDHRVTGRIAVTETEWAQTAEIFTFEGDVYAVTIAGFEPQVAARLASGGRLSEEQVTALAQTEDAGGPARSGALAVAQGWVTPDVLAAVHQEFTVAAFGAVVSAEQVRVHADEGPTTDRLCAMPLPLDALLATVQPRTTRRDADERVVTASDFGAVVVQRTSVRPPAALGLPEFGALLDVLDGVRPADVIAASLGFTRAEIAHLLAALTTSGSVIVVGHAAELTGVLVPEQFGQRVIAPPTQPVTVAPASTPDLVTEVPDGTAEPGVSLTNVNDAPAESVANVEGDLQPDLTDHREPEGVLAPEPELPAEPEPEPEPNLPSEPEPAPGPDLPPEPDLPSEPDLPPQPDLGPESEGPLNDFATAALRAELATAEHWAAEVRSRLERELQRRHES